MYYLLSFIFHKSLSPVRFATAAELLVICDTIDELLLLKYALQVVHETILAVIELVGCKCL